MILAKPHLTLSNLTKVDSTSLTGVIRPQKSLTPDLKLIALSPCAMLLWCDYTFYEN